MRTLLSLVGAALVGALLVGGALRGAAAMRRAAAPEAATLERPACTPAVWVFVRAGCTHCRAHLEALDAASRSLAASERARLASRLRIIGDCDPVPVDALHVRDDAGALHVTFFPTTWIWNAGGEVERVWRGARSVRTWTSLLRQLALREAA